MLEDRRLLWRLRHGDKDALRLIYEKYEGDLLTLAAHLLHDPATAEDVVQDVFIGLVRTVPKLHLRRTLRAYLATAVANRVRDHYRKRSRERLAPIEDAGQMAADMDGPVQIVGDAELMHKLQAAVAELPYEQREVVDTSRAGGSEVPGNRGASEYLDQDRSEPVPVRLGQAAFEVER